MLWKKLGLIYRSDGKLSWAAHSALQPTPILLNDDVIRVFVGFRDSSGVGRIGYVDLSSNDPAKVIGISKEPVVNIGQPGAFDENGVVPCAAIKVNNSIYLYYAGYQLGHRVRFLVFSGLAVSDDGGYSFIKMKHTPVLERSEEALLFRVIHSIVFENGKWRVWYGAGSEFRNVKNKAAPIYNIRYLESSTCTDFPSKGIVVLDCKKNESRVGRPYILEKNGLYRMFFAYETTTTSYRLGYADSTDRIHWNRNDKRMGLRASKSGWDSQMVSYPSVIETKNRTYLFYNGNDYGKEGFGCAVLKQW
jgi:predicted GH43/DUF377 family glycosyl hydrolase